MTKTDGTLEDAIAAVGRQATSGEDEGDIAYQVLGWLMELRDRREEADAHTYQLAELGRALHECREELARLRQAVRPSQDDDVHIRVEISQNAQRWMAARKVSAATTAAFGRALIVPEEARRAAEEAAIGFLEEVLR